MSTVTLPAPLVPAEVDLRDFPGMWVDVDRLLRSDTWLLGSSDEKAAAFTLWAESWHQVPAASLPDNDRVLAKLSQAERWGKTKAHALRGWVHCNDGRLYHPVVAEKALEAWVEKLTSAISGAVGNAKRWQIEIDTVQMREQLRTAVDALRGLAPTSRALKKKAVIVILAESPPDQQSESGGDTKKPSPPDSGKDRKGPDQTRPDRIKEKESHTPPSVEAGVSARAECGKALKAGGLDPMHFSLSDPRFIALVDQGATPAEFEGLAREAIGKGIKAPFSWVLTVLQNRRQEAAAIKLAPPSAPQPAATTVPSNAAEQTRAQLDARTNLPEETPEERERTAQLLRETRARLRGATTA